MEINKELFDWIDDRCKEHEDKTNNQVQVHDVIFSYIHFEENGFNWSDLYVLNDWDEGKNNDPFWDEELDKHSAESFILNICKEIKWKTILNTKQ